MKCARTTWRGEPQIRFIKINTRWISHAKARVGAPVTGRCPVRHKLIKANSDREEPSFTDLGRQIEELGFTGFRISIPELADHPMTSAQADAAYKAWTRRKQQPGNRAVPTNAFTMQGWSVSIGFGGMSLSYSGSPGARLQKSTGSIHP